MRSAALQPAQQGSTSQPQRQVHRQAHAHSSRRQRRREGAARLQAVKEDCRDKVNSPQHTSVSERTVKVTFQGAGGQAVEIDCPEDMYVLEAGLEAGLELPYTCRGGICGACVGRVVRGRVDQSDIEDLSFTVSEDEQEQGMALLCMSRPDGDCVIETQSDWGYSLGVAEWKGATGHITGRQVTPLTPWKEEGS